MLVGRHLPPSYATSYVHIVRAHVHGGRPFLLLVALSQSIDRLRHDTALLVRQREHHPYSTRPYGCWKAPRQYTTYNSQQSGLGWAGWALSVAGFFPTLFCALYFFVCFFFCLLPDKEYQITYARHTQVLRTTYVCTCRVNSSTATRLQDYMVPLYMAL